MNPLDFVLPKLDGVIDRGKSRYYAKCPAHDDKSPSLSIRLDNDRLLLYCFAGCATESVLDALGLGWTDLYADPWRASKEAATARGTTRLPAVDPLQIDRMVLTTAAADIRAGKTLSLDDRARVELARKRLAAAEGIAA